MWACFCDCFTKVCSICLSLQHLSAYYELLETIIHRIIVLKALIATRQKSWSIAVITPSINHVTVNPQSPCNLTLHILLTLFLFLNCCLCIWKLSEYKYNNIIPIKGNECLYYKPTYIRIIIQPLYFKLNTRTPFSKSEARRTSSETQGTYVFLYNHVGDIRCIK